MEAPVAASEVMPCDLDNDGRVGLGDLALFSSVYHEEPGITTDSPLAYRTLGPGHDAAKLFGMLFRRAGPIGLVSCSTHSPSIGCR